MNNNRNRILESIDYVEFYVGNALQSALFYEHFWGFELFAYSGHETGNKETVSYALRQSEIILVVTAAYNPEHSVAKHVALHGDSVKKIGFNVSSAKDAYERSLSCGAKSEAQTFEIKNYDGVITQSSIKVYGDTIHTFIEKKKYSGVFLPGFVARQGTINARSIGLTTIDHITANIESGTMEHWINFYKNAFGFKMLVYFDENDIFTEYSAMSSKVVMSEDGKIKLPLTEPINKERKSQIQEFIDYNMGAGIQHLAFNTSDMIQSVQALTERGVDFLKIPHEFYDSLHERVNGYDERFEDLKQLQIMIDGENNSFLLQAFTKPVLDRPTYFIELIQRKGAASFGKGNVKALFNALVSEQQKRENL
jgi:4-hydroxyphenylpyruvate dioxygenase